MSAPVVPLADVPGTELRNALRSLMAVDRPWQLIVDARGSSSLNRFAVLLRLRRRARARGGDIAVVVDEAARERLTASGMHRWLPLTASVHEARQLLNDADVVAGSANQPIHVTNPPHPVPHPRGARALIAVDSIASTGGTP
jgi:hypothetical protein